MTRSLYKELVTIYKYATTDDINALNVLIDCTLLIVYFISRASADNAVKISTRTVQVHSAEGLDLFGGSDNPMNAFYLVIDPLKKQVHVLRFVVKSMW